MLVTTSQLIITLAVLACIPLSFADLRLWCYNPKTIHVFMAKKTESLVKKNEKIYPYKNQQASFTDLLTYLFFLSSLLLFMCSLQTNKNVTIKNIFHIKNDMKVQAQEVSKKDAKVSKTVAVKGSTINTNQEFCLDVPILIYHHIQPLYLASEKEQNKLSVGVEYLDMHMRYLVENGYKTISLDDVVHALINHQQLPPKAVAVTFDDGYKDIYTYAFPILKKYNIITNLIIPTGLIGKPDFMTWDDLKEMQESGLSRIYNHTTNHVDIGNSDKEKIEKEILTARNDLHDKLGISSKIFVYPYGSSSKLAIDTLQQNGFIAAFSTQHGTHQCTSSIMNLYRDHVGNAPLDTYGL